MLSSQIKARILDLSIQEEGKGEHRGPLGNKTSCFPWGQSVSAYYEFRICNIFREMKQDFKISIRLLSTYKLVTLNDVVVVDNFVNKKELTIRYLM